MILIRKFLKNIGLFRTIGRPRTKSLPLIGGTCVTVLFILGFSPGLMLFKLILFVAGLLTWGLALVWWTEDVQAAERARNRD